MSRRMAPANRLRPPPRRRPAPRRRPTSRRPSPGLPPPRVRRAAPATLPRAFGSRSRSGASQLGLVLKPRRLGQMEVKLALRGPAVRLSIDVESNSTRHLLSAGADELRDHLKDAGLQLEKIRITVNER